MVLIYAIRQFGVSRWARASASVWYTEGYAAARRAVYEQLAGASGAGAVDYYGGLLVAMDAIQQNVVTPTFGAPTARYAYVIATPLRIRAAGIIGTLQERATVMQLSAGGLIE